LDCRDYGGLPGGLISFARLHCLLNIPEIAGIAPENLNT
jgi:hypothetical protein